ARSTQCLNNLRQIGIAARLYADDNDDSLPLSSHNRASWIGTLQPYLGTTVLYRCPSDSNRRRLYSYAINDFLTPTQAIATNFIAFRITTVPSPSDTLYMGECHDEYEDSDHFHFADESEGGYKPSVFANQVAVDRHYHGANYLFVDTHVEYLPWL